ncbi:MULTISPECIES: hypothetical protein, partial [unclassified Sporosarcina]|uniref:hypothetical protein n=1 Tax=unclassified Sporosarcina TaxID=2647733 RepID=UPI00203D6607
TFIEMITYRKVKQFQLLPDSGVTGQVFTEIAVYLPRDPSAPPVSQLTQLAGKRHCNASAGVVQWEAGY